MTATPPGSVSAGTANPERLLSDVLSEFARTLVTDFPIQAILDHLVVRIVDVLPISAAGVTLISPGVDPRYIAASDESALVFEQLQSEMGEGPCVAAYRSGVAVAVSDLGHDDRFPLFAPRALAEGLAAVFTFPLRQGDHRLGALDLYRDTAGSLDAEAMAAAQTLADVAAAYLINAQARAELQDSSERSRQSSLHDALTGLPNRTLLLQRLDHAILRCRRSKKTLAVLFADLDDFKAVNDTYGHHVGDELLVAIAGRLTGILRAGDTLARLAGDEFVILCEDLDSESNVGPVAARIDTAMAEPFVLSDRQIQVTASVGVAFAGRGDATISQHVLQDADAAMYQAKRNGGARHAIIDLGEQRLADKRASLSRDLPWAAARGELRCVYQPIVSTASGRVTGVETLLRWAHPSLGMVTPDIVVPLAERGGFIAEIGRWVLEQACGDLRRWQRRDRHHRLGISVNVSAHELLAAGYSAAVAAALAATGTDAKSVTIEVTETVFVQDADRCQVVFGDLKDLGVNLALDDFGTGYSSSSYLKTFPVDTVKIDRTVIAELAADPISRLIASSAVLLAQALGMAVVAEGIETAEQYERMAALGCDSCQGFLFARPMPADDLDTWLAADRDIDRPLRPTGTTA